MWTYQSALLEVTKPGMSSSTSEFWALRVHLQWLRLLDRERTGEAVPSVSVVSKHFPCVKCWGQPHTSALRPGKRLLTECIVFGCPLLREQNGCAVAASAPLPACPDQRSPCKPKMSFWRQSPSADRDVCTGTTLEGVSEDLKFFQSLKTTFLPWRQLHDCKQLLPVDS